VLTLYCSTCGDASRDVVVSIFIKAAAPCLTNYLKHISFLTFSSKQKQWVRTSERFIIILFKHKAINERAKLQLTTVMFINANLMVGRYGNK